VFGRGYRLFRLAGFEVKVDPSWGILALLVTWSLAEGLFPFYVEGLSRATYWVMGAIGVVGLLGSIVIHEFSHSMVARRYGMPIHGISLFIFGGVAEMHEEPPNAKTEFLMAIAGPAMSIVLAFLFYYLYGAADGGGWPRPVAAVLFYLTYLNGLLAAFNLVPAFPLDGGRMLRAALWGWRGDIDWATRIAARIGSGFGAFLAGLGIYFILTGRLIGGLWWILIGAFLHNAAMGSYRQLLMRERAGGQRVRDLMTANPVTVEGGLTVDEWVRNYVYKFHYQMYPVVEEGALAGCVHSRDLRELPESEWSRHSVRELRHGCHEGTTVSPDDDAGEALSRMTHSGNTRLLVTEGDRLVGILTLKDMVHRLRVDDAT